MTQNKINKAKNKWRGKLVIATDKSYVLLCTYIHIYVHLIANVCLVQNV